MDERRQREMDSFQAALGRPPDERPSFLSARHEDDPELVDRLLQMLHGYDLAAGRPSSDGAGGDANPDLLAAVDQPAQIGPYRILERLGEGGMGVVYAAEQVEPFRRRVAVKVVKLGMDTREVVARFMAERQALAMLDHPGVAKALDAGVTPQGRPYFVMELVKGLPLVEYCRKQRLPLRDRLRLFVDVCAAVHHAHQRGIIHRDLKPSNVLVAIQEGRPMPKVIDFGVAKATATRLTERTVFTEQGRLIGTPEYMSPEQAEMSGLDVDIRTDVYSLGVVLYELLTGVLPFDPRKLRAGGYSEILRVIREVDAPRPSARLAELERQRDEPGADFGTPARALRGELDWIVMRAIAKDRTRRYGSASALSDDIERYLADLPVLAGPPGLAYGLRKFVKRHRFVAAAILLGVTSSVLGVTGLTVGLLRAREAEVLASRRADNAQAAAEFLEQVLFQADPEYRAGELTLMDVMRSADELIRRDLGPYPEVEASVRESLGVAFRRRSRFALAEPHLRRSLEIRRDLHGDEHLETASSFVAFADLRFEYGGHVDEASGLLAKARAALAACGQADTTAEAWLLLDIGLVHLAGDRVAAAESALGRCRELLARDRGAEHPDVSRAVRGLAKAALLRGDHEGAERLAREAATLCEGEGEDYIAARAELVLAQALMSAGRLDEVGRLLEETGETFDRTVGGRHIRVGEQAAAVARYYLLQGDATAAGAAAKRCEELRREILAPEHWAILEARLLVHRSEILGGRVESAEAALVGIADGVGERLGPDHPLAIEVAQARLDCALARQDSALAEVRAERLAALRRQRQARL